MLDGAKKSELCLKCMECCKILGVPTPYNKDNDEFYHARGHKTTNLGNGWMLVLFDEQCPFLASDGCEIYKNRPRICREYDGTKDPVIKHKCLWTQATIAQLEEQLICNQ